MFLRYWPVDVKNHELLTINCNTYEIVHWTTQHILFNAAHLCAIWFDFCWKSSDDWIIGRQFIQAHHRLHWFCGCSQRNISCNQRNIELMPKCGNAEAKSMLQMAISNDFGLGSPSWLVRFQRISEMNQFYCIPSTIFLMNMWRYITQRTGIKYAEETERDSHEQVISFVRI